MKNLKTIFLIICTFSHILPGNGAGPSPASFSLRQQNNTYLKYSRCSRCKTLAEFNFIYKFVKIFTMTSYQFKFILNLYHKPGRGLFSCLIS